MRNQNVSDSLNEAELSWVKKEAFKSLVEFVKSSMPIATFIACAVVLVMYPYVDRELWLVWLSIHALSLLVRLVLIGYLKNERVEEFKNHEFISILATSSTGLTWGSTAYPLIVDDWSKIDILILNFIFIFGVVITFNLSKHFKIFRSFLISYGTGLLGSVLAFIIFHKQNQDMTIGHSILIIVLLYLAILHKVGTYTNKSYFESLRLRYMNKQLIDSLTIEKQIAVKAVEVKNRIMASATHDMRQPILALDLYTEMLALAPENSNKLVPKISEATKSVITMFDAMFDLGRISSNQLNPARVKFNLKDIIGVLEQQYTAVAKDKGLEFRVQYENSNREILDDPILLRRILSNLISNAIKYTETGGILLVCRDSDKYGLRIEVWDTGVGISPSMQEAVFSEFYKNPENTGTSEGFGLGLAIVDQLCVLLGHKLTMKSRRGRGTVVSIRLSNSVKTQSSEL